MDEPLPLERRQGDRRQYGVTRLFYAGTCGLAIVLAVGLISLVSPSGAQPSPSQALPSDPSAAPLAPEVVAPVQNLTAPLTTEPRRPQIPTTPAEVEGFAALERIDFPWRDRLSGWAIEFHPERSGYYGLTIASEKRILVYVRENQSLDLLTHVIAHELGHAVDVTHNTGAEREQWRQARQLGNTPWWPGNAASDFATGAGDFAESFAYWQTGSNEFRATVQGPPTAEQLLVLSEIVG